MYRHITLCILMMFALTFAQTINLHGQVSNSDGKPIANAVVTLAGKGLKDTTGADGTYAISSSTAVISTEGFIPQTRDITFKNGILEFCLPEPLPVRVEIFTIEGKLLKRDLLNGTSGFYHYDINRNFRTNLLIIRTSIGPDEYTFRHIPSSGISIENKLTGNSSSGIKKVSKMADISDTLIATATGYTTKKVAVSSLDMELDISLDSAKSDDFHYNGNPAGPSAGCGKDPGSLKSGTYTISSSGLSRQYIIDIPADYDKNHPYRLIFGMHCYGSTMQGVAGDKYYQLKRFADSTKTSCIFVAPNGTGSDTPLWNQGEKDHAFFDDMVKLFKDKLCVDTTRIFSCGFSYGAMFSFSLSTNHQKVLRAVACYAPANWNIWLPVNTHEPIAFMSTTGMSDPNCPFVRSDETKEGGKYCSLIHAEDNGCTIPATLPTAAIGSKTHTLYEFQGGKAGYPVKLYTFDGAHQCGPMDGVSGDNSSKSWIPGETWKFFMQF